MRAPCFLLGLLLASVPLSGASARMWTATSTASIAITGDIEISADHIAFENGAHILITPLGADKPGIYRVDSPVNPTLKNGNRLCGEDPPTFVALGRAQGSNSLADSNSLHLKVFNGSKPPPATAAIGMASGGPGLCAILNYER